MSKYSIFNYLRKGNKNFRDVPALIQQMNEIHSTWWEIFPHSGLILFAGSQGTGKTTSAIQFLYNIAKEYPRALICTNVEMCLMGMLQNRVVRYNDTDDLTRYGNNGLDGVIFLIDEIHLQWNSLESKSVTPADMIEFAQSRKQRRLIIGTSQRIGRLAKPMREQLKYVVVCNCLFGLLQRNTLIDMETAHELPDGSLSFSKGFTYWFFHDYDLRNYGFDTYQKMSRAGANRWRKN